MNTTTIEKFTKLSMPRLELYRYVPEQGEIDLEERNTYTKACVIFRSLQKINQSGVGAVSFSFENSEQDRLQELSLLTLAGCIPRSSTEHSENKLYKPHIASTGLVGLLVVRKVISDENDPNRILGSQYSAFTESWFKRKDTHKTLAEWFDVRAKAKSRK